MRMMLSTEGQNLNETASFVGDGTTTGSSTTVTTTSSKLIRAREIIQLLKEEYDETASSSSSSWTKARNYIYHASDKLTVDQVRQVVDFLNSLSPNDTELPKQIVQSSPRILRKNVQNNLKPTAKFLLGLWGTKLFREALKRNPNLLLSSGIGSNGPVNRDVELLFVDRLQLKKADLKRLKQSASFLFSQPTEKLAEVIDYFESILKAGSFPERKIPGIIAKMTLANPQILRLSVKSNLEPRVEFLKLKCGFDSADIASLIKTSGPVWIPLSVSANLEPTLDFFAKLVPDQAALRKSVLSHPAVLGLSIDNLNSKVDYFDAIDRQGRCSMDDDEVKSKSSGASLASRMAVRCPAIYSLSLSNNIIPKVDFLALFWNTTSPHQLDDDGNGRYEADSGSLATLLKEYPNVLTLSLEGNIQPTINFFNRTGYAKLDSDGRLIEVAEQDKGTVIRGRYLAASLYNRLLPRWHFCIAKNIAEKDMPPLHLLATATDLTFCKHYGFTVKEFQDFKTDSIPKLKFSSQFDTWLKTGRPIDI